MSMPFDPGALAPMIQQMMQQFKAQAAQATASGQAGGGLVEVTANGQQEIISVRISADAMDDREMLEDLVTAAANDALRNVKAEVSAQLQQMTGGLPLPPGMLDGLL